MPKKVITRRQRKAAEAKRQYQQEKTAELKTTAVETTPEMQAQLTTANSAAKQEQTVLPPKPPPKEPETDKEMQKTPVKIKLNDRKVCSDKKLFEENNNKKAELPKKPVLPPTQIEQASFSKSITRRAAATINKIQKLSKAFNKKINPSLKQASSSTTMQEPMNLAVNSLQEEAISSSSSKTITQEDSTEKNKPCDCEFCKVVLTQLLSRKKKSCKNSRRLANQSACKQLEVAGNLATTAASCEECSVQESFGHRQRFLELMEINQREIERSVRKRIKELKKIKANKKLKKSQKREQTPVDSAKKTADTLYTCSPQPDSLNLTIKSSRKTATAETTPNELVPLTAPLPADMPKEVVQASKENFFNVMQQLAFTAAESPPLKVLGVTGYFVLTGTTDQLNAQLSDLQQKNVFVQQCMELTPGTNSDQVQLQLDTLLKDRELILQQMANIHLLLEPRRQKRLKKQRKFPKL